MVLMEPPDNVGKTVPVHVHESYRTQVCRERRAVEIDYAPDAGRNHAQLHVARGVFHPEWRQHRAVGVFLENERWWFDHLGLAHGLGATSLHLDLLEEGSLEQRRLLSRGIVAI